MASNLDAEPVYMPPSATSATATDSLSQEPVVQPPTNPAQPTKGESWSDIAHGAALGLTAAGEGVVDIPGAVWNLPALGWNATRRYLAPSMPEAPYLDIGGMTARALGLPQPQTEKEQKDFGIVRAMGGLAGSLGTGAALEAANLGTAPTAVGRVLAAQPGRQAATTAGVTALQEALPDNMSPEARGLLSLAAGGAIAGVGAPGAIRPSLSTIDQGLVDAARTRNIPIYSGQIGSGMTRQIYDLTGKFPGSGMEDAVRNQQTALNSAIGNTFGAAVDNTGRLGPQAMANARAGLSNIFNFVASRATPTMDQALQGDLNQVRYNLARSPAAGDAGVLQNIQDIENLGRGAPIPSDWLIRRTAATSPLSVAARGHGEAAPYYAQILDALHDSLQRGVASPADLQLLQNARTGWKNMMTVERLVAQGNGDVSPGSLNNAVANNPYQFKAYTGGGELGLLGEIGKKFIKPPPTSGTAERSVAYSIAGSVPTAIGLALSGHPMAALGTVAAPVGTAIGAAGINKALRAGGGLQTPPVSLAQYYARALANVPTTGALTQR